MNDICVECRLKPIHTHSGLCRSCCQKGSRNHFAGKKHSEEVRKKISEKHADVSGEKNPRYGKGKNIVGNKNPNWKGGVSFNGYSYEFKSMRAKIKKRDEYRCWQCWKEPPEVQLSVHHIDYDKENNDPVNLITLCMRCNAKANSIRWARKNTFSHLQRNRGIMRRELVASFVRTNKTHEISKLNFEFYEDKE